VVSSNQSTIWTALRALGVTRPITGFGRLLESLAPARPLSAAG
jgi:maleate cis-trans isomerase